MPRPALTEEHAEPIINNAPVGIAVVGLGGRFQRVNDVLCQLFGRSSAELMQLDFQLLTHPDDLVAGVRLVSRLVSGELPHFSMRKRYLHADGHTIWADLSTSLIRDEAGKPLHFVSHITDRSAEVVALERAEEANLALRLEAARLARSNHDLESFALLASHDLQTPLATVRGYLELLATDYHEVLGREGNAWLGHAADAAERMASQLSSLLEFARATHDDTSAPEPVDVPELVGEIVIDLEQLIGATHGVIEVAASLGPVLVQRARLRQVLQTLLENSLRYRNPKRPPHVTVSVSEDEAHWLLEVCDDSRGIPDRAKDSVFAMFTRLDEAVPGHGIGLSAARRNVDHWGGNIWVEDNPGGGSCLRFTIPR
ncbi:MAG: ATP-binding protein [Marmoricola sp.]